MTTIIIEDEKPAARLLQRKLEKFGIAAQTMLHSVEEALAWFADNAHPDLIFLDIQLSDGLSFERNRWSIATAISSAATARSVQR